MENIIRRIIELEHQAQKMVDEAREEEQRILRAGQTEDQTAAGRIRERADNKINQLKGKSQYDSDDRVIRIYEDTAMKMRLMEENAEENQAGWEDEIFNRIIGR